MREEYRMLIELFSIGNIRLLSFWGKVIYGDEASVEFDPDEVIEREELYGDVAGFYHTHPRGIHYPSRRDSKTHKAWVRCLGKNLFCAIRSGKSKKVFLYSKDGYKKVQAIWLWQFILVKK